MREAAILGVDPGTRLCGFGVIEPGATRTEIRCLESGVIRVDVKAPLEERLAVIYRELSAVIARIQPGVMAIEQLIFAKNPTSALKLGHARGVALLAAVHGGLSIHEYLPNAIKKTVSGHGHASKEQVQQMVKLICGLRELP
ncbi:MAG: crossover junction endodeoxyribonuclease RuvC, partial [Myxococcales bacterium]|nr:crossover junction endodeoxyribonuclease RuvC [Myxococcales bacterium]